ncbi:potassium-transporting ATPase subunit F [bacterium]|nr:potassium-transporting ATPase subunit F [bacterium]
MIRLTGDADHGRHVGSGRSSVFRGVGSARRRDRRPSRGGLNMDWTTWLGLGVACGLTVYLAAALLVPERFS